jgi:hypothetical protein
MHGPKVPSEKLSTCTARIFPKIQKEPVLVSLLTTAGEVQFLSGEAQGIVCHRARVELTGKDKFSLWAFYS